MLVRVRERQSKGFFFSESIWNKKCVHHYSESNIPAWKGVNACLGKGKCLSWKGLMFVLERVNACLGKGLMRVWEREKMLALKRVNVCLGKD